VCVSDIFRLMRIWEGNMLYCYENNVTDVEYKKKIVTVLK